MKRKRASPDPAPSLGLEIELPGASARTPISIRDLTATIRELLEENLAKVWVAGEISNFRAPASGHLYFTLKDETATLQAVMFRFEAAKIGFALRDGMAIVARGAITVYEARGQYQLQVAEVRPRGEGGLQQRFEELKRRLQAENLFALERKKPLPVFPESIGIVTSLQGAVLHDIRQVLQRRAPGIRLFIRGVRVQGPGASEEIAGAIAAFSAEKKVDLVVIARGGGSLEDLWAFNEEVVARALATCALPTISAVGHETDFTIADFVADLRAPTPSAAAELLTRDWNDWRQAVDELRGRLERTMRQSLATHRRHLAQLGASYALREPRRVVRQLAQRLDEWRDELQSGARRAVQVRRQELRLLAARLKNRHPAREIERRRAQLVHLLARLKGRDPAREVARQREHLSQLAARLRTLGPQGTLDRGYALALDSRGHPLTQARAEMEGQSVRLILARGSAEAQVTKAYPARTLIDALAQADPTLPAQEKKPRTRLKKAAPRKKEGGNT
jgi:exodeoxyribonuclease VII large subunit